MLMIATNLYKWDRLQTKKFYMGAKFFSSLSILAQSHHGPQPDAHREEEEETSWPQARCEEESGARVQETQARRRPLGQRHSTCLLPGSL